MTKARKRQRDITARVKTVILREAERIIAEKKAAAAQKRKQKRAVSSV